MFPERLPEKGVSLSKIKGKFLPPISQQHQQVLLFGGRIVGDRISVELLVHILSYLIPISWITVSVKLFFFFPYAECSPCDLEKCSLVVDERELGEQNSFSYHSQLLSLCSSFSPHLNVSWSYAAFGIYLTFHVLPN